MTQSKYEQVFGFHAVRQIFANDISRVVEVWAQARRHDAKLEALLKAAQEQGLVVQRVPKMTLDKFTDGGHHQGILIRCQARPPATQTSLEDCLISLTEPPFLLVLDEVQDPHNLGACLRTAEAAGIQAVIVPKHRACTLTPTVRKIASGAAETVPFIQVTNLATTLRWLQDQGIWLVGADQTGHSSLFETNLTGSLALVLGAEGSGLRRLTRELCDVLVSIPMLGQIESLNVSVAAGICLYEAVRQRHWQKN
jgi:23S rRNA (guanosine2251-2'-O)-methyltransferase